MTSFMAVTIVRAMNSAFATYYFWYFSYPTPQAEDGARMV